jgi:hypothetical protein
LRYFYIQALLDVFEGAFLAGAAFLAGVDFLAGAAFLAGAEAESFLAATKRPFESRKITRREPPTNTMLRFVITISPIYIFLNC